MSFSPRPRPNTVGLSFTDHDLTDTYRDDRSSHTAASSPQRRHPRGDTPLSRRQPSADDYSSPGRWTVSSRRSASERDGGEERDEEERERSNLDKLLDLLDDDDGEVEQHHPLPGSSGGAGRSFATSTPPPLHPGSRSPYPPTTARRPPLSSRRSPPHASPSTAASATATYATESPFLRAHHRSLSSLSAVNGAQHRPNSALARFSRSNGLDGGGGEGGGGGRGMGVPDSPSPRPGSVAALRGKGEGSFAAVGERSGVGAGAANGAGRAGHAGGGKGKERAYEGDGAEDLEQDGDEGESTEGGSLDSVARVAQAAMDEFDTIISHGVSTSSRSASRLRNIPSPARTPTPPASSAYSARSTRSSPSRADNDDLNAHLVRELRDAQDYIAYLQDELRSISDVVVQLRERPEPTLAPALPDGFASSETPSPVSQRTRADLRSDEGGLRAEEEQVVLEDTSQAAFEVVKHLTSLLPSLSLSSASSTPQPSLSSLGLALSFTRQIDQLAHNLPHARRDEDVFRQENLEGVLRRVKGWERVVRGGEGEE
ncbi:hypothetical protein JCM6882_008114 [Rhodosporidiobolus microsporus]